MSWNYEDWQRIINATPSEIEAERRQMHALQIERRGQDRTSWPLRHIPARRGRYPQISLR